MVQPSPQQGLGFNPGDVEFDLAKLGLDPDVQLDQVKHFGVERDPGEQIVQLEVDFVDLDDGNVDDDVGFVGVADFAGIDQRVAILLL